MQKPRLKNILIGIFLVIFIPSALVGSFIFVILARDKIGYCAKQGRFLTEEEKIHSAINRINRRTTYRAEITNNSVHYTRIPYANSQDFIARNPGCCRIEPASDLEVWINKFGGSASSKITIDYKNYFIYSDGVERFEQVRIVAFTTACGYIEEQFH